jgi:hypothetical protein
LLGELNLFTEQAVYLSAVARGDGRVLAVPADRMNEVLSGDQALGNLILQAFLLRRCVVLAAGAQYPRPDVPGLERFEGRGIYYAATPAEARLCRGQDVAIVGAGNSAGQAAVFLPGPACSSRATPARARSSASRPPWATVR